MRFAHVLLIALSAVHAASAAESLSPVQSDHPDYPEQAVRKALGFDANHDSKSVITTLEDLQQHTQFKGVVKKTASEQYVQGTLGVYDSSRELMYLLLGRAYYERGDFQEAE